MKKYLAVFISTIIILFGCATVPPVQDEPRKPEFLSAGGTITSVAAVEVPQPAPAEPEPALKVKPAEAVEAEPVPPAETVEETASEKLVETAAAPPEAVEVEPVQPIETAEEETAPEKLAETAAVQPEEQKAEPAQKKPETAAAEPVQKKPETAAAEPVPAPVLETREPSEVVIYPESLSDTAAKEVEDRNSAFMRAAWFGLPILLLMLVILFVEMVRWFVYKKPLFGWSSGVKQSEKSSEIESNRFMRFFRSTKSSISGRFSKFMDRLYEDLEDEDEEEQER